jgi:hypothetical protein
MHSITTTTAAAAVAASKDVACMHNVAICDTLLCLPETAQSCSTCDVHAHACLEYTALHA